MTRSDTIKFLILRSIGNFLVLFAIFGVVATFGPAVTVEATYRIGQLRGIRYQVIADTTEGEDGQTFGTLLSGITPTPVPSISENPDGLSLSSVLSGPKEQILTPKDPNFSIIIPKIGASAKVFPNVDPIDEKAFLPVLAQGIAHAKGTVFPGMSGNVYLFAHSTDNWWNVGRYNALFYLLKDVSIGDEVVVFFEGRRYNYVVSETKIVAPTDVSHLVDSHGGPSQLILQTCWPPGTTWERLLVIATPKSEQ